jgi:hypothetical protein
VVFASDPTTASEWLGFAAIMLTLAGLVGYLVRQARSSRRARRDAANTIAASLPSEYRFRPESLRFRVMGGAAFVCATVLARVTGGPTAMVIAATIIALPLYSTALRHRSQHRREIIQSVRRDAADMDDEELRELVEALEFQHGDVEMRPLRRVLATRLQDHPT